LKLHWRCEVAGPDWLGEQVGLEANARASSEGEDDHLHGWRGAWPNPKTLHISRNNLAQYFGADRGELAVDQGGQSVLKFGLVSDAKQLSLFITGSPGQAVSFAANRSAGRINDHMTM